MKMIIGLGNPGEKYAWTRHNTGFLVLDSLRERFAFDPFVFEKKFLADIAEKKSSSERSFLVKPKTYMNLSGKSVRDLLDFYKEPLENILVIHDDLDLLLGTIRETESASSAGQHGVGSIIQSLGTQNFKRIRVGIGPRADRGDAARFVLEPFTEEERRILHEETFPEIEKKLLAFLSNK